MTGTESETMLQQDPMKISQVIFLYDIFSTSEESLVTIANLLEWRRTVEFFGDGPVVANLAGRGKKPVYRLLVKTRGQNGGTDTVVNDMLSLMSFEGSLVSTTYSDGSTAIRSRWSRREDQKYLKQLISGLQATSIQDYGTLT